MSARRHWAKPLVIGVALLVTFQVLAVTLPGTAEASTTRALEITEDNANPEKSWAAFDGNPTKLYDIDGDGSMEIIAQNDNQHIYIFDSRDGTMLAELKTNIPPGWSARSFNGPEVALMEKGGSVHVILANSAAIITSYRFQADNGDSFSFVKEWDVRLNRCHDNPGMDARPVLADLDKDGSHEILAATEESGFYVLRDDGTTLWKRCLGGGNAAPGVADLNQDGWPDVVHVSDSGFVSAMRGSDGGWMWGFNLHDRYNLGSGSIPVSPGIGQLDGKGGPDIVIGARDSHDPNNWDNDHALLLALSSTGKILWGTQHPDANPLTYTRPIVVDADGDGTNEVYWGDWNTNGHKPPTGSDAWQRLGPANFYRYSNTGDLVWRTQLDTWWSNKDLALADVDGDGVQEVLANGPKDGNDGIWYLDSRNGDKETFVSVSPWKVQRPPVVADLWGQGTTQWVVSVTPVDSSTHDPAMLVFDTGQPYDAAWPHVPYPEVPGGSGSGETFDATFEIKNPNEWWQELYVDPDQPRTITDARVQINDGTWQPMSKSDWGAWTSSYNTPSGSKVEFRVFDDTGAQSTSEPFTWMNGETTKRSTGSSDDGGTSPFEPGFRVSDNVNEWWVEVYIDSGDPIQSVSVQVNGGSWTALEHKDWGAWAKSMHVEQGSDVVFRATRTDGAQATSQTYQWMVDEGSAFEASFTPKAQGNDWWIEVKVEANKPVASVDTKLDDGQWRALDKTDWGTWAKSYHAPDGTQVQFRATSDGGSTVTSQTYTWD